MEGLWEDVFQAGYQWNRLDDVYEYNWDFSDLENDFNEGGALHGKKVYLYGSTEPQLVSFEGVNRVICVPVVVAIVSPFPPSGKIGICSVRRESEEITPMEEIMVDWVPYIPLEDRDDHVDRLEPQIFILSCTLERAPLSHSSISEYCLPYFYNPFSGAELEQSTEVQIIYPLEPPVICEFDWVLDELKEFTDRLIEDEEALPRVEAENFKEFVKEKVRVAKRALRQAREDMPIILEEMREETRRASVDMRFYQFYPVQTPDRAHVEAHFIHRYYGKAHELL